MAQFDTLLCTRIALTFGYFLWLGAAIPAAENATNLRVLCFPSDSSLGALYTRGPNPKAAFLDLGNALGEVSVSVPDDQIMELAADPERVQDLATLGPSTLEHIDQLRIYNAMLDGDDLNVLSQLHGIETLLLLDCKVRIDLNQPPATGGFSRLMFYNVEASSGILPFLANPSELKTLSYHNPDLPAADEAWLDKLPRLEELELWGNFVKAVDLSCLARLPVLQELALNDDSVDDMRLRRIGRLTSLRKLNLTGAKVSDAGLVHLSSLVRLESLNLHRAAVTDTGLRHLVELPLRELNLRFTKVTDAGCADLAKIKSLESLTLPDKQITDEGLVHIAKLSNIRELTILRSFKRPARDVVRYTDAGLENLTTLKKLEKLEIADWGVTDTGMAFVARMPRLKQLMLFGCDLSDEGLAELQALKHLEWLEIWFSSVTVSGLNVLNELTNLEHLKIWEFKQDHSGLDLSALQKLHWLELIPAEGSAILDQDLATMGRLKRLRNLQITGRDKRISNQGLAHLRPLTDLQKLIVGGGADLTDEGLRHLASLKGLTSLKVYGNFTDDALPYFEQLPPLKTLNIYSSNKLNPEAKQRLQDRFPDLINVSINSDRSFQTEVKQLNVGDAAPEFVAATLDGNQISLTKYRGKTVLLYFWATWCSPCIASLPGLQQWHDDVASLHGDDFVMISLAMDEESMVGRIRKLVDTHELTWVQARIGNLSATAAAYGVTGAPTYFLIGPDGKIASTSSKWHEIKKTVADLLDDEESSDHPH